MNSRVRVSAVPIPSFTCLLRPLRSSFVIHTSFASSSPLLRHPRPNYVIFTPYYVILANAGIH
jgi:hypothetical protein